MGFKAANRKAEIARQLLAKKREVMTFSELKRLSFCNSDKLPEYIQAGEMRMQWVGIGWIDCGPADGSEVLVVEDEDVQR